MRKEICTASTLILSYILFTNGVASADTFTLQFPSANSQCNEQPCILRFPANANTPSNANIFFGGSLRQSFPGIPSGQIRSVTANFQRAFDSFNPTKLNLSINGSSIGSFSFQAAGFSSFTGNINNLNISLSNPLLIEIQADQAIPTDFDFDLSQSSIAFIFDTLPINVLSSTAIQAYAANQSVSLNALSRQRNLLLEQAGTRRGFGFAFNGASVAENQKPQEQLVASAASETLSDTSLITQANPSAAATEKTEEKPFFFWASVGNSNADIFGNGSNLAGYSSGIFNSLYGLEYKINQNWTVGSVFGYGTTNLNSTSLATSISSTNYSGNIYGVYKNDSWRVAAALGYTRFNLNSSRTDLFNLQQASASYNADGYSAGILASYDIYPGAKNENSFRISPLLGLSWDVVNQDNFNETGAGSQNLAVQGSSSNSLISTLGVGMTAPIQLEREDQALVPRMSVSWRHDYLAANPATTSVTAGLVSAPAVGTVTSQGQNLGPDSLNLTASLELQMGKNVSLYGGADYQVATNSNQFGYSGGVRIKF